MACSSKLKTSCCDDSAGGATAPDAIAKAQSNSEAMACESNTPSTATGCCSNGRSCDGMAI